MMNDANFDLHHIELTTEALLASQQIRASIIKAVPLLMSPL